MGVFLKENLDKKIKNITESEDGNGVAEVTLDVLYTAVTLLIKDILYKKYKEFNKIIDETKKKRIYYISMEFLMGKRLKENVLTLGISEELSDIIDEYGYLLDDLYKYDVETKLGSGGLGRLGACFLDSFANLSIPGCGYSICYENGLFKQKINGLKQTEEYDDWLYKGQLFLDNGSEYIYDIHFNGYVEEKRINDKTVYIHKGYDNVKAIRYDMYVKGMISDSVSSLRLWKCIGDSNISKNLYPNDENYDGKVLRLKQQYFLCSSTIQDIINEYLKTNKEINKIDQHIKIHINDTHPTLCIPEFIRILTDYYGLKFDRVLEITNTVFSYTNHTILKEALEKWPIGMIKKILPRIYLIIEMLDKKNNIEKIIDDHYVNMANLCVFCSSKVNGVSEIHSEIIKNDVFNKFYSVLPNKFTNVTNGIAYRRWLVNCNGLLTDLLKEKIGDSFIYDMSYLKEFNKYANDDEVLNKLSEIKFQNKVKFSRYAKDKFNIDINPNTRFDVQIKRFHEYKRQLLNVLKIIYYIILLEENKEKQNNIISPTTFIFSGKAAPNYKEAKDVIELILNLSEYLKNSPIKDIVNVVFIPNYDVEVAEMLIPASEVSEQISLAGYEASGTGNMKFMANGAITIGTLDGANVEICEEVCNENIVIFGIEKEEVFKEKNKYNSRSVYENNELIKKIVDRLDKGFVKSFSNIKNYLLNNDRFMCLIDLESYINAYNKLDNIYKYKARWNKMSLINIANSGRFSSDRAIMEYYNNIWK